MKVQKSFKRDLLLHLSNYKSDVCLVGVLRNLNYLYISHCDCYKMSKTVSKNVGNKELQFQINKYT